MKMKNHLIAQAMASAAIAVTAAPGRNPRMGDGDGDGDGDQAQEGTVPNHALQTPATWPALPASQSFNDLRRERAKMKPRALPALRFFRKR